MAAHDPQLAERCDRMVELVDGQIASDRANASKLRPQLCPQRGHNLLPRNPPAFRMICDVRCHGYSVAFLSEKQVIISDKDKCASIVEKIKNHLKTSGYIKISLRRHPFRTKQLRLRQHRFHCLFLQIRRVAVFVENTFNHYTDFCARAFA